MEKPLQGRRILVTRPSAQAAGWCRRLHSAGAEADCIPMLDIVPITDDSGCQAIKQRILDFDQIDHAIFVSRNAVRFGFEWLDAYWPQLPMGTRFYAIGAATAAALEEAGVQCQSGGESMDSEALLALPALQDLREQKALIFRGRGGRPLIGETLRERGARVDYCELYDRSLPDTAISQLAAYQHQPDAIAVHSGETLQNLAHCIDACSRDALRRALLVCPSARVAAQGRELGFAHVVAATNAGDDAMFEALRRSLQGQ
ncbi:Uroporphyrinogen-III synthase [Microbulbifer aggregans]|uniref:Uroporphyrinogen-III synthase n=1 Tax=Microbulbifer aggregans TaxID=1769779 RepID=A0A1C9W646_9GAMM|nr:uroporphyrinogen-III synthase [Microbulbifer aggregans]AOS96607.1 Uroporphyrinogen-III synthase [Microbulbifer aggregans]